MALPSGYIKLEYIESTGTQYINTGVSAPEGMRVECQAEFTSLRSGLNMLFGSHDAADPYYRNYLAANSAGNWELGAYGVATFGAITTGRKYSIDVCTISGDIFAKIDGMSYYIGDIAPSTKRSSLSVYLFALHYAGGLLWASAKLYGAKIYLNASGGNPIRDFIPCKNASGVVGMWDDANGQFYTNAGTGAFTAGPEVKPALTAHKTLVNGTAYTVQSGKCMVGGTVYNILKGRTLIDGTGYDIVFPVPLVMPVKGDLITMNLDGTDRQYRVLKIIGDTTIEVLGMWDVRTSIKFNLTANNAYRESYLDTYLNTTYYKTLSANAKAAIVAKSINQYQYAYDGSAYKHSTHASYADYSTKSQKESIGDRYVYVLDVEDVEMYFGGAGGSTDNKVPGNFSGTDLIQMFWGNESTASGYIPLLRSGSTGDIRYIWRVDPNVSYISRGGSNVGGAARPAFQIDLSKIDFTIN